MTERGERGKGRAARARGCVCLSVSRCPGAIAMLALGRSERAGAPRQRGPSPRAKFPQQLSGGHGGEGGRAAAVRPRARRHWAGRASGSGGKATPALLTDPRRDPIRARGRGIGPSGKNDPRPRVAGGRSARREAAPGAPFPPGAKQKKVAVAKEEGGGVSLFSRSTRRAPRGGALKLTVVHLSSCSSSMPPTKPVTPVSSTTAPSNSSRIERGWSIFSGEGRGVRCWLRDFQTPGLASGTLRRNSGGGAREGGVRARGVGGERRRGGSPSCK